LEFFVSALPLIYKNTSLSTLPPLFPAAPGVSLKYIRLEDIGVKREETE
jgi:hypothetical protein